MQESRPEHYLLALVGPEIITGSTRLKAGTATKLILNMLSTGAMVQLGKVYGNLMVDMTISNNKLQNRAERIIQKLTPLNETDTIALLKAAHGEVKTALLMHFKVLTYPQAKTLLDSVDGMLHAALKE